MRVLITGGYGFIGAWIARNLLARGDSVFVYDLKEDPRRLRLILPEPEVKKVAYVQGDVTDLAALKSAVAAHAVTHVIHLAGLQVLQRGERPHLLPGLGAFERGLAAVDGLRRRPRPRHDERADQGDQGGPPRPAVPHQLRRVELLPVRGRRGEGVCAVPRLAVH